MQQLYGQERWRLIRELEICSYEGRKIVYSDQICFTKLSFPSTEWSAAKTNVAVDQKEIYTGYSAAMVTVSVEDGVELYDIQDEPFKAGDVISHLKDLRAYNGETRLAILLD